MLTRLIGASLVTVAILGALSQPQVPAADAVDTTKLNTKDRKSVV